MSCVMYSGLKCQLSGCYTFFTGLLPMHDIIGKWSEISEIMIFESIFSYLSFFTNILSMTVALWGWDVSQLVARQL